MLGSSAQPVPIRIGDDIQSTMRTGNLRDLVLRVQASGTVKGDVLAVTFNDARLGTPVTSDDNRIDDPIYLLAVQQGLHQLTLGISLPADSAKKPLSIQHVRVDLHYRT